MIEFFKSIDSKEKELNGLFGIFLFRGDLYLLGFVVYFELYFLGESKKREELIINGQIEKKEEGINYNNTDDCQ